MKTYQISVSEETYRKFCALGERLDIPDAGDCFDKLCDIAIVQENIKVANDANKRFVEQCDESMLHPSGFEGANVVFGPPDGMTEGEVHSLICAVVDWNGTEAVLTCWKPTQEHIDEIQRSGRIWITQMSHRLVPMCVMVKNPIEFDGVDAK